MTLCKVLADLTLQPMRLASVLALATCCTVASIVVVFSQYCQYCQSVLSVLSVNSIVCRHQIWQYCQYCQSTVLSAGIIFVLIEVLPRLWAFGRKADKLLSSNKAKRAFLPPAETDLTFQQAADAGKFKVRLSALQAFSVLLAVRQFSDCEPGCVATLAS